MRRHELLSGVAAACIFSGFLPCAAYAQQGLTVGTAGASASAQLQQMYPGAMVITEQGRISAVAGAPMSPGLNPAQAAQTWIAHHGQIFGAGELDLRPQWETPLQDGRATVIAYQQYIQGYPVEHGTARILVKHQPINRVVYVGGNIAPLPERAFGQVMLTGEQAIDLLKAEKPEFAKLPEFSNPELVVFQGEGEWAAPTLCWKFSGEEPSLRTRQYWTFFVDATLPRVTFIRNEILHNTIAGNARGRGSPGMLPDIPSNPSQFQPLPGLGISAPGLPTAYTDVNGNFTIEAGATASAQLSASLDNALWVAIADVLGPTLSQSVQGTSGGSNLISFNGTPTAANTAQVNVFIHTNKIHDFIRSRSGNWSGIDHQIDANVNINDSCNAYFTPAPSINFFRAGGACPNTGYSSIVAHEYGHFVVNRLGLGQGGFGEGFSDTCSMLLYNDAVIGRNFFGASPIRTPYTANQQYPCTDAIHECGQILAGIWWGVKLRMETKYGAALGLERTQQFFVDWALVTSGGAGPSFKNSAHPGTAIEMLVLDDDDGYLANGTPHYYEICQEFRTHNINCPIAPVVGFEFPNGRPQLFTPGQPGTIEVNVIPMMGTPVAGSGRLIYRVNNGQYNTVTMTQTQPNRYIATVPAHPCNTNIDYYFSAQGTPPPPPNNPPPQTVTSPLSGAPGAYWVGFAHGTISIFEDDFETNQGWSGVDPGDTATTGRWTRNIPQATAAQPGEDHTPGTGLRCWITDHRAGTQVSDFDVDDGHTSLTSPAFNLLGRNSPRIGFWLWYNNVVGIVNPGTNVFTVLLSSDNGNSWFTARTFGMNNEQTIGGWKYYEVPVQPTVPLSSQMRMRFVASDYTGSIVEAAVDDVKVYSLFCDPMQCYPNCDGSVTTPILNIGDFSCFLQKFAAGDPYANCDQSTTQPVLNVGDFSCFLQKFAAGCP